MDLEEFRMAETWNGKNLSLVSKSIFEVYLKRKTDIKY